MRVFSHEFVLGGNGAPPPSEMWDALVPRGHVQPDGRPRTLHRAWLDTFDWRLHRAGLTLEYVTGPGPAELVLTRPDGERVSGPAGRVRWPAFPAELPDGPVREALTPVTGVRALLPAARATSTVRSMRACNTDDKTVAWLVMDQMAATSPAECGLPSRLCVTPVRGYQSQADKIAKRLAAVPGVAPAGQPAVEAALAAGGRHRGDYSGKVATAMTESMPARQAVASLLVSLLDTLETNVPGTIADIDTEFLHDLRVAVRRSRSALKLAGHALPDGLAAEFAAGFKWLGDATTPVRDLDVYLLNYPGMAASLASATPAELEPFHHHLVRRRAAERRKLVRALRSARFTGLVSGWRATLERLPAQRRPVPAGRLAAEVIRRAHKRVLTLGTSITDGSPPEKLHSLRKRCKELRYALEFFAPLYDHATHRQAVRDLKDLQDCLGTYQDCQVQQQEIRVIAGDMMAAGGTPATALLAMGDLAAHVAGREWQARSEFAGRFADFASLPSRLRFATLTEGGAA